MHNDIKLNLSWDSGTVFMHVVAYHHSEENTDRGKFSTFKGLLLYGFLLNQCQKMKVDTKLNCNQIHINQWTVYILYFTFYLHFQNNCSCVASAKEEKTEDGKSVSSSVFI